MADTSTRPTDGHAIDQVASARAGLIGVQVDLADGLNTAQIDLASAKKVSRNIASHLPVLQGRPGSRLLETERKLLTHAIQSGDLQIIEGTPALPAFTRAFHSGR